VAAATAATGTINVPIVGYTDLPVHTVAVVLSASLSTPAATGSYTLRTGPAVVACAPAIQETEGAGRKRCHGGSR
jgi:hypothetical protein